MLRHPKRHTRRRRCSCGPAKPHFRSWCGVPIVTILCVFANGAFGEPIDINPPPTFNQYGEVGLIDMPSARLNPDGEFSITVSANPTMERYNLGFQALPWLETVFRYSRLDRYLFSIGVPGDLYDRSLSVRARLFQESGYWPAIAIGAQDVLGTGAFGAEYIVASKNVGDFDLTGGMGWRRFGDTATFPNPVGAIFPSFKTSTSFGQQGTGVPLLSEFFHGAHAGLFGGVEWQTPISGLKLIGELSGDKFTVEQSVGSIKIKSPLNFGFSYEPVDGFQIGAAYLYGSQFGVRITLHLNPFTNPYPQKFGTPPPASHVRTEESRNEVELALLQDKTHFYDNWPAKGIGPKTSIRQNDEAVAGLAKGATLADAMFDRRKKGLKISNVEIYGENLLLNVSASGRRVSCSDFSNILRAASGAHIHQIVYSTTNTVQNVGICAVEPQANSPILRTADDVSSDEPQADEEPSNVEAASDATDDASEFADIDDPVKKRILKDAAAQSVLIQSIAYSNHEIDVSFLNARYRTDAEAIGRLVRVLMADTPDNIEQFHLIDMAGYLPARDILLHRSDIERVSALYGSPSELLPTSDIASASPDAGLEPGSTSLLKFPAFSGSVAPGYRQSLFDPDDPYRFQIFASLLGNVAFDRHFSISGDLEANIYSTLGNIARSSNSLLPHVRSDFALYFKHGSNGIGDLTANYLTKLSSDTYLFARAGYLESMYAGVGAEIFWQPDHQRFAFGAAIDAVRQRSFDRLFGLRSYQVVTGHVSAYYDSPFYNLNFQLHVGRYLAGDWGATFQVTRRFASGVEMGIYATLTNVPFSVYGEGSFDKGFIVRIPIDFLAPVNTQEIANFDFSPLTRDGGQRVAGEQQLYDITRSASEEELLSNWDQVMQP